MTSRACDEGHSGESLDKPCTLLRRPPSHLYEVRTCHGEAYHAEGNYFEQGNGWFTLWADDSSAALHLPEADIRVFRQVSYDEYDEPEETSRPEATPAGLCRCGHDKDAHGSGPHFTVAACPCREYVPDDSLREQYALAMAAADGHGPDAAPRYYRYAAAALGINASRRERP